ncbi:MAG: hypothetical protein WBZ36_06660 [Candidatus Nitrosopolaris sp.]
MDLEGVEFRPKNVIRNPGDHRIDYILMKPGHAPGEHRGEGEKWLIRLEKNEKTVATIYFSKEDAKTFMEKVKKSAELGHF